MSKYNYLETVNNDNDEFSYTTWDVHFEDEEGFVYICECVTEADAILIVCALNEYTKGKNEN